MTLGPLALAALVLLPTLVGAAALAALGLGGRGDRLAWLGRAQAVGSLVVAAATLAVLAAGARPDGRWLAAGLVALAAALALAGRRRARRPPDARRDPALHATTPRAPRASSAASIPAPTVPTALPMGLPMGLPTTRAPRWERALFAACVALAVGVAVDRALLASRDAIAVGDEAHIWASKAKVLWHAGGLGDALGAGLEGTFVRAKDYPLLQPLLQVGAHAWAGELVHVEPRLPAQALGVALLLLLAGALRRRLRPLVAGPLVLAFAATGPFREHAPRAMSDALVMLGALTALDAWLRWHDERRPSWLVLAGLGLAFAAWSKNEGLLLAACGVAAAAAATLVRAAPRPTLRSAALALAPLALVVAVTVAINAAHALESDLLGRNEEAASFPVLAARHLGERWRPVATWLAGDVLLHPGHTRLLWVPAVAALALFPRRLATGRFLAPSAFLALSLAGLTLAILGTPRHPFDFFWHATVRVTHLLLPAACLWTAAAAAELWPSALAADRGARRGSAPTAGA